MGLGTALAVMIAGGARGYRAGQELQRRLAQAERMMKMQEEELALKKAEIESRNMLYGAQTEEARAQTEQARFETGEKRRVSGRAQSKLPSPLRLGGLNINTYEDLAGADDYMRHVADMARVNESKYEIQQRLENPEAFSAGRRQYLDPESEAMLGFIQKFIPPISDYEAMQPGGVDEGLSRRYMFMRQLIEKSGTPKLRALILGDTTKAGGNRFRGK